MIGVIWVPPAPRGSFFANKTQTINSDEASVISIICLILFLMSLVLIAWIIKDMWDEK